jgi:hypothetical protein
MKFSISNEALQALLEGNLAITAHHTVNLYPRVRILETKKRRATVQIEGVEFQKGICFIFSDPIEMEAGSTIELPGFSIEVPTNIEAT